MSRELYSKATIFDIECDGFLEDLTTVHCIAISWGLGEPKLYTGVGVEVVIRRLMDEPCIVGHNIMGYDIPAIQKIFPWFKPTGIIRDTLVMSRLQRVHQMQGHSLEDWGRLKRKLKGDFKGPWDKYIPEMGEYCKRDVSVNIDIWEDLVAEQYPEQAIVLEHKFAKILQWQMSMGVPFDVGAAKSLRNKLAPRYKELEEEITKSFPVWTKRETFIPKRDNRTKGYVKGVPFIKEKVIPFNPGSRDQVVRFLKERYGWVPVEFTDKGNPKLSGDILRGLKYPEAPLLAEYFDHKKLLGQLDSGKSAWLKLVRNGRIYGFINHNGAVTGRCTHSGPNLGQVPRITSFMGRECRSLFHAPYDGVIVGCDASGLELRNLAHYLAAYDNGAYAKVVSEGDVHTENQKAAGLDTRDDAKTFIYAHNYGAGDAKLGSIVSPDASIDVMKAIGRRLRTEFTSKIVGLGQLIEAVKDAAARRGYLIGLDGRKLWVRSQHKALNTLLQGAGSVIMKQATVNLWEMWLQEEICLYEQYGKEPRRVAPIGGYNGQDSSAADVAEINSDGASEEIGRDVGAYAYPILHVHDEFQSVVCGNSGTNEEFARIAVAAIEKCTEQFGYRCPLTGESKIGTNWADTH